MWFSKKCETNQDDTENIESRLKRLERRNIQEDCEHEDFDIKIVIIASRRYAVTCKRCGYYQDLTASSTNAIEKIARKELEK